MPKPVADFIASGFVIRHYSYVFDCVTTHHHALQFSIVEYKYIVYVFSYRKIPRAARPRVGEAVSARIFKRYKDRFIRVVSDYILCYDYNSCCA